MSNLTKWRLAVETGTFDGPKRKKEKKPRGMYIYLITNKINGKKYVGRTTQFYVKDRWRSYRWEKDDGSKNRPIVRAIKKYGLDNFTFKVLEKIDSQDLGVLNNRESFYIKKLKTLTPNGYNIMLFDGRTHHMSEEGRERASVAGQGTVKRKNKSSQYVGVFKGPYNWHVQIIKDGVCYNNRGWTEEEAAEIYDMSAMWLYGPEAVLNFPEKRDTVYSEEKIDALKYYYTKQKTRFHYISYNKTTQKWKVNIYAPNRIYTQQANSETEAAQLADLILYRVLKRPVKQLNFPERIEEYKKADLGIIHPKRKKRCKYKYVTKGARGSYIAKKISSNIYKSGFNTELEAHEWITKQLLEK